MKLDGFDPISLAELNAKAEMLTRLDRKYVISSSDFEALSPQFAGRFDILEVNDKRSFGYRTCYFDTERLDSYRDHVQGRRRRSKVRVRRYLDAGFSFLEVKLKSLRKTTVKKRLAYTDSAFDSLTDDALGFIDACHRELYERAGPSVFQAVIKMQYDRLTLVAHEGGERVTIDRNLRFWNANTTAATAQDMILIETKSRFGRGIGDTILRRAGHHPIGSCSKYCLGLATLGVVPRFNKFQPAFRRLAPQADGSARTALAPKVVA